MTAKSDSTWKALYPPEAHAGHDSTVSMHAAARTPGTTSHVVTCPTCRRRLRYTKEHSSKSSCPDCHGSLIILIERNGTCRSLPETLEALDELVCSWIGEGQDLEEDEFEGRTAAAA